MRIGMDVGGTTARIRLVSEDGRVWYTGEGAGGTLEGIGREELKKRFAELLNEALTKTGLPASQCTRLVAGASGVDSEELRAAYEEIFRELGIPRPAIRVMNDGELLLNMFDHPAVVLIAGTGSIALGTDGKKTVCRCGGWEHLLSDEGSATWLGLQLLRAVVQDEDGQVRAPMIRSLLADHAGIRTAMDAVSFAAAHIQEKSDIAGLATLLEPAAEAGDEEAKRILEDAAGHLFALVENLAPRICEKGTFDLLLWGSVLHKNQAIRASLTGRVHQAWPLARVLLPTCTALDCAVLLAQDRRALAYREI